MKYKKKQEDEEALHERPLMPNLESWTVIV